MRDLSISTYPFSTPKHPFQFTLQELEELKPICLNKCIRGEREAEKAFANTMDYRTDPETIQRLSTFELKTAIAAPVRHEIPLKLLAQGTFFDAPAIPFWGFKLCQALEKLDALTLPMQKTSFTDAVYSAFCRRFGEDLVSDFFGLVIENNTKRNIIKVTVPPMLVDQLQMKFACLTPSDEAMRLVTKVSGYYQKLIKAMLIHHSQLFIPCDLSLDSKPFVGCQLGNEVFHIENGKLTRTNQHSALDLKASNRCKYGKDLAHYEQLATSMIESDAYNRDLVVDLPYWNIATQKLRTEAPFSLTGNDVTPEILKFIRDERGNSVTTLVEGNTYLIVGRAGNKLATVGRLSTAVDFVRSNPEIF